MAADLKTLARYEHLIRLSGQPGPEGVSAQRFVRELEQQHPELPTLLKKVAATLCGEPGLYDDDDDDPPAPIPAPVPGWLGGIERVARAFGEGQQLREGAAPLRPGRVDVRVRPDTEGEVSVLIRLRAADVLAGRIDVGDILKRVLSGFRPRA